MAKKRMLSKKERQNTLIEKLKEEPFFTDEELRDFFSVSIQTIRLDRLELGIPELRERIKKVAEKSYSKVRTMREQEIFGELVDLELGKSAISILQTDKSMTFKKTNIVRGHYIFALAESIAISVIDAKAALTGVANIKYKTPIRAGEKLVAKAEVVRSRSNKYFVWVRIRRGEQEAFRGKFILVSIDGKQEELE